MTFAVPDNLGSGDVLPESWVDQVRDNFTAMSTWSTYTPTWTQSATITKTVDHANYVEIGDLVIVHLRLTATSAGTANNTMRVSLPSTHNHVADSPVGSFWFNDAGTSIYTGIWVTVSNTPGTLIEAVRNDKPGKFGPTATDGITVASGDSTGGILFYQKA